MAGDIWGGVWPNLTIDRMTSALLGGHRGLRLLGDLFDHMTANRSDQTQQTWPFTNISGFTRETSVPVQSAFLTDQFAHRTGAASSSRNHQSDKPDLTHNQKQNRNRLWNSNSRLSPGGR